MKIKGLDEKTTYYERNNYYIKDVTNATYHLAIQKLGQIEDLLSMVGMEIYVINDKKQIKKTILTDIMLNKDEILFRCDNRLCVKDIFFEYEDAYTYLYNKK